MCAFFPGLLSQNAEIFTLTYGSMVRQLVQDLEDVHEVNRELERIGHSIGLRLADEYVARSGTTRCSDRRVAMDRAARVGFKLFLSVQGSVAGWSADGAECSLVLEDNPLVDFVELPEALAHLKYSNVLPGVLRGAFEAVGTDVECTLVKEPTQGDDVTEIRVRFLSSDPEAYPFRDDD